MNIFPPPLFYGTMLLLASVASCPADPLLYTKDSLTIWGETSVVGPSIPDGLTNVVAIAASYNYCLALKANGTIAAWGANQNGVRNVPAAARNIVAISAARNHCLALKADGTVVQWGTSAYGLYPLPDGLENITAIATGFDHCMAMSASGGVTVWGGNSYGNGFDTPFVQMIPPSLDGVKTIAAGDYTCAVLGSANRRDFDYIWRPGVVNGNVVLWGNHHLRIFHPYDYSDPLDCTALAVGSQFLVGLLPNGTVVVAGAPGGVSGIFALPPPDLTGVTAISMCQYVNAGILNAMALKSDGTVVVWGNGDPSLFLRDGAATVNATGTNDVGLIASGEGFHMALRQPRFPVKANSVAGRFFSLALPPRLSMASYTATGLPLGVRINATTGVISGASGSTGFSNAVIQVKNTHKTLTFPIRFLIDSAAYGTWGSAYWTPETTATASSDDPDGDGLQNGVEYGLGTNPTLPDPSIFQQITRDQNGRLSLTLDLPSSRTGLVQWKAVFSATPAFTSATEAAPVTEPGAATGFVRHRFTDPTPGTATNRFGRLKAILQ